MGVEQKPPPDDRRSLAARARTPKRFMRIHANRSLTEHSSLTHLGIRGVSAILLQAKSRHLDPRTLARYAKPGIETVAALTA